MKNYNRLGIEGLFASDSFSINAPLKDSPACLLSTNIKGQTYYYTIIKNS